MSGDGWIELGRLGAPYGNRGWIHVDSHTDPPERLLEYRSWVLRRADGRREARAIEAGRLHQGRLVVLLEGAASREAAAALTGTVVEVERSALPRPGAREYYRADLIGMRVRNLEGADFGTVSHFVDAPQGALMVAVDGVGRERWLRAAPPHLQRVDLDAREVVVDWPAELE